MADVTLDDFETDFEGALSKLADQWMKVHESIPPEERSDFYVRQSTLRLARLLEIKAPGILIEREERLLAGRLRRRARERRQQDRQMPP